MQEVKNMLYLILFTTVAGAALTMWVLTTM
jgi:hypothetical protein